MRILFPSRPLRTRRGNPASQRDLTQRSNNAESAWLHRGPGSIRAESIPCSWTETGDSAVAIYYPSLARSNTILSIGTPGHRLRPRGDTNGIRERRRRLRRLDREDLEIYTGSREPPA